MCGTQGRESVESLAPQSTHFTGITCTYKVNVDGDAHTRVAGTTMAFPVWSTRAVIAMSQSLL